jgi:hypothetical protein
MIQEGIVKNFTIVTKILGTNFPIATLNSRNGGIKSTTRQK